MPLNYQRPERTPAEQAELDRADRRQFWIIAVIFTIAISALTLAYVAISDVLDPPSASTGAAQQIDEPAMPVPDGGAKPTDPGDRGGSEQLLLMGGLVVALGFGTAWVVHSSRRAKRRLASAPDDRRTASDGADGAEGKDETPGEDAAVSASTGSQAPR